MDLFFYKRHILEMAVLGALATLKLQNPSFDEVTKSEAYKIAGSRRWLDGHIKKGNITPVRRGTAKNSPVYYSRLEIAALKEAEATLKAEPK